MRVSERRKRRRSVRCHFGRVRLTTPARSPLPPPTRELAPTSSASSASSGVLVPTRIPIRQKSNQPASKQPLSLARSLSLTPSLFCVFVPHWSPCLIFYGHMMCTVSFIYSVLYNAHNMYMDCTRRKSSITASSTTERAKSVQFFFSLLDDS